MTLPTAVITKKRILIIEDDPMLLEMYRDKLKIEGFRVSTVSDAKKALTRARQGADLILLDILMPGLNGFEILKRLKNEVETEAIPVIVITNIGNELSDRDKKLALSLGADDFMIKALNTPDDIVTRIRSFLKESSSTD